MAVFAWRRRVTRHFGEQRVPFAEVSLRSTSGRWQAISLEVDTGAVVSVLKRSVAGLLGIEYGAGEAIDLASVGSAPQRYAVHQVEARIGELPPFPLRVAFAEREDVPNLLGRLDLLDRFQVDLDVSLEETRLAAPWLNANRRLAWRHVVEIENTILEKWADHPLTRVVDAATRTFVKRADELVGAVAGLLKLHRDTEVPLLIRALFELSVQFEYLMRDPETRASLYLDFGNVTKYQAGKKWGDFLGPLGDERSSRCAEGEIGNRARYEAVRSKFLVKAGGSKLRAHWYPGTLRDLASDVGRAAEYDAVYGLYSAWAHGESWTAGLHTVANGGLFHAFAYWARLLIQVADAKKIILTGEAYQSLVVLAKGLA